MKHEHKVDNLLRQSLRASEIKAEPSLQLQMQTIEKMKERYEMLDCTKNSIRNKISTVLLAGVLLIGVPVGAFAAWQLLSPAQVATKLNDNSLAQAFESEDAISINQVKKAGDYQFTLLGLVSGASCSDYMISSIGLDEQRTYAAIAIERQDGKPMPDTNSDAYGEVPFVVSPLIQGELPWQVNIFTMSGGYAEFVQDGVQYRLVECDDIMPFADRNVWLSVTDGVIDNQMFLIDEKTGNLSENPDYMGINLLFQLPLDTTKADPERAKQLLKQWSGDNSNETKNEYDAEMEQLAQENQQQYAQVIAQGKVKPESVRKLTQDKNGIWWYKNDDGYTEALSAEEVAKIEKGTTYKGRMSLMQSDTEWIAVQYGRDEQGDLYGQEVVLTQ